MLATSSDPGQNSNTLLETELLYSLGWMISIRWLAGIGVLAATWATGHILRLRLAAEPLYFIGAGVLAYNLIFLWAWRRLQRDAGPRMRRANRLAHEQIATDWIAMTLLIHFSGGVESPAIFYFFFHIALASILLSLRATFFYAALATCLVGGTTLLEYTGYLPHVAVEGLVPMPLYQHPAHVGGVLFFFVSAIFVVAYLASGMMDRLRKRETEVVQLTRSLQRAYSRLETLYEGAKAVSSTLDLQQVLNLLVENTARAMGARACSIRLLDESGTRLRVAAVYGLSEAYVKKGDLELDRNPVAREVLEGRTVIVDDVTRETGLQFAAETVAEGIRAFLSVPLPGKEAPLGLMRAYSDRPGGMTQDDAAFLEAAAGQGSIAIRNAMTYQALGRIDEMKSKFVRMVTHELRSPVSVVQSLLRTMLAGYTGAIPDAQRDVVERALRRANFLETLINDLLDLASGKAEFAAADKRTAVSLKESVERVVRRFDIPAKEKQVQLEWRCESDERPITISAANEDVDRILNNLVSNAIKYTPPGGRVSVQLHMQDDEACLDVSDTGIGIPEDSMPHLFEEFFRAPNAKAKEKEGTGLGLAITKDLVTRYGGHIAVRSKLGEGTTFCVRWPLAVEPAS
ncbi:MAG: GAF domain-containing sensor histidine kinase [Acidobacteriota bacterium]